jgi:acetyl esterase/lipase
VFFHGGGFILAAAPHHYALAREYASRARCRVVFPDYRLAPKHPFPAAAHDCADTYCWTLQNAETLRIDPTRVAVGGDSAGGDLAAVTAQMARDLGWTRPVFQLLIYPVTDRRMQTASAKAFRDTPLWNTALSEKMWRFYLPDAGDEPVCYASPIEAASFADLAPAYVEVADFDALRDEGIAYAQALRNAGVPTELRRTKGTPHGFEVLTRAPITRMAAGWRCAALHGAFYPDRGETNLRVKSDQ